MVSRLNVCPRTNTCVLHAVIFCPHPSFCFLSCLPHGLALPRAAFLFFTPPLTLPLILPLLLHRRRGKGDLINSHFSVQQHSFFSILLLLLYFKCARATSLCCVSSLVFTIHRAVLCLKKEKEKQAHSQGAMSLQSQRD